MKRMRLHKKQQPGQTLADIAKAASVSTATVSRYLNNPGSVRPERAERVREAIAELGYVPHGAARALASQRSMTIGAVIPTLDNAIFARGIEAFQRRLYESGYTLLLACFNFDLDEEIRQIDALMERRIDGMLLIGFDHHPDVFKKLDALSVPYVCSWAFGTDQSPPCVGFDNRDAMHRLTTYLMEVGHKRFGMLAGETPFNDRARERVAGVVDILATKGLKIDADNYIECAYTIRDGRLGMRALMEQTSRPTIVMCGNDVIAYGALLECQAIGIQVPGDVSITGFDDLPLASNLQPTLTTVRVPAKSMGQRASDHLISRISGKSVILQEKLDVELIIRETTAPPNSGE